MNINFFKHPKTLFITSALWLFTLSSPCVSQTIDFSESWTAYQAMKAKAQSKPMTWDRLPDWSGVWTGSPDYLPYYRLDKDGTLMVRVSPKNTTETSKIAAPLSPEYQAKAIKVLQDRSKGIDWDYVSNCIPAGFPRWVASGYLKEFALTPKMVWMLNEEQSEVRRVYIDGREHTPRDEAYPLFEGDSVGFWDGDTLVVHTVDNKAGTWDRSGAAYSDQVNTIERIRRISDSVIEDQMTIYDKLSLTKPWNLTVHFKKVTEPADLRIRMFSCNENNNVVQDATGNTRHVLPGEAGYKDPKLIAQPAQNTTR